MEESNNIKFKIPFNFSYFALKLLGKQLYTNKWSAISELVANGLDAGAKSVKLYINSIDKKNSSIEIFDDGSGMSFDDLSNKYTMIGRNRRLSEEELSEKVKGRKGIGKLATLYLTKKYYIVTKQEGKTTAWVLDSTNASENDVPELVSVDISEVGIENEQLWNLYTSGTLLKLVDVDMSGFGETRLKSLKQALAEFYILDNLGASIEVAYRDKKNEGINYETVEKSIAFKNFYSFFSTNTGNNSEIKKLSNEVYIKNSRYEEFVERKRTVKIHDSSEFEIKGKKKFLTLSGEEKEFEYNLSGWIGIHSTIKGEEARENDANFIKNDTYNPSRIRLYVRDKLAVDNFYEYLGNTSAMRPYIEGEISFDILDHNELEDISTPSREGFPRDDIRIKLLKEIVTPIVNRLINDRNAISAVISQEDREEEERRLEIEREERRKERRAREREAQEKRDAQRLAKKLEEENIDLRNTRSQLENQNKLQKILLEEKDPDKQELFVHELNTVSDSLIYTINDLSKDFHESNDYDRVSEYVIDFKRSADRLSTIKRQFLKLGSYDLIGKQIIDMKSYVKSYLKVSPHRSKISESITDTEFGIEVDVFELAILLDNLITNAVDSGATEINFLFEDENSTLFISSDTAPIKIQPVQNIFELGISSKAYGTGVGLYIVKEICDEYGWEIDVEEIDKFVVFKITMRGVESAN
ncbi:ATP-binding protein [Streptococcus suis]|uniref:sensor histidine kinase n=1 Tax=Streptococcus suis TaxID=1307 RepID=UPI000CF50C3D|nr:sensor histidine kinase [Streptococcus suis]MBM7137835.1 sensor histidine kinase [Streptococcus suis]MBY4600617.1 ATP-binding protein [Streptococcus suis]MCO8172614.1 ATP-binding protein [Streptococcus suis]MCO8181162.1 ATP-binding protein [Streptococcus suis]MCO8191794.1 ATP-binding protein [Streptococcus suis]